MNKINILSNELANMIAAGEVVERPSSVIKELVENSIDANAKTINVSIIEAGRKQIIVADDGEGMDRQNASIALKRYATSKIISSYDLNHIKTLGFRGEALPSIASVSRIKIDTSTGENVGTQIISNEQQLEISDGSLHKGTTITVEELFYNTPARLKFLKSDYIENANNIEMMTRLALSHPHISFSFTIDDKQQFKTTGRGKLLETILNVYGHHVASNMIKFNFKAVDYSISGYLGKPEIARSNRYYIQTFLNTRSVYMPKITNAIINAYEDFLPPTRFPFVIIDINVEPALVDVNVHPTKREVRFSKEEELKTSLVNVIVNALKKQNLAPKPQIVIEKPHDVIIKTNLFDYVNDDNDRQLILNEQDSSSLISDDSKTITKEKMLNMTVIGQAQLTFIIAEDFEGGLYLIDQHAAHERINYEKYKALAKEKVPVYEPLITPILNYKASDLMRLNEEKIMLLKDVGVIIEQFGKNEIKVRQLPIWAKDYGEKEYSEQLIEQILEDNDIDTVSVLDASIAMKSCRRSIKASDRLSLNEMQFLIDELKKCDNPYFCPHGRPTIIHFTAYQLDKMFKRTGF
jgi:DNA mismatch repair protein MutL